MELKIVEIHELKDKHNATSKLYETTRNSLSIFVSIDEFNSCTDVLNVNNRDTIILKEPFEEFFELDIRERLVFLTPKRINQYQPELQKLKDGTVIILFLGKDKNRIRLKKEGPQFVYVDAENIEERRVISLTKSLNENGFSKFWRFTETFRVPVSIETIDYENDFEQRVGNLSNIEKDSDIIRNENLVNDIQKLITSQYELPVILTKIKDELDHLKVSSTVIQQMPIGIEKTDYHKQKPDGTKNGKIRIPPLPSENLKSEPKIGNKSSEPTVEGENMIQIESVRLSTSQKISFINGLIQLSAKRNIDEKTKERLFALVGKELEKSGTLEEEILREVRGIKSKLEAKINQNMVDSELSEEKRKPEENIIDLNKHRPIETSRFLQNLSSNNNPLKYLIHDKPDGFNLQELVELWLKELKPIKHSNIKEKLGNRIFYLSGGRDSKGDNKGWYSQNEKRYISFSYADKKVIEWCLKNPNVHPILHFDNEIEKFKKSIKFYDQNLLERVKSCAAASLGELFGSFEIDFQNFDKELVFYADADAFLSGLKSVFSSIKQRVKNSNKIKILYEKKSTLKGRLNIIRIIHLESECDKELTKATIFSRENGGDLKEAEIKFYQVCDWSIIAKNPNLAINKLNILYDITEPKSPLEMIANEEIEGFTHVFTFYS